MKSYSKIKILFLTTILTFGILLPFGTKINYVQAQQANPVDTTVGGTIGSAVLGAIPGGSLLDAASLATGADIGSLALKPVTFTVNLIGEFLLRIGSIILIIVSLLFDTVIDYTIVHMADQINDSTGLGGGINIAWATLRDIANMAFIFVLLWAAIQTILDLETAKFSKTIKNIIIIALLINFSLFFSKVIIDASNIATIGFYQSIIDGAKTASIHISDKIGDVPGFSAIFMKAIGIQSFWSATSILPSAAGQGATTPSVGVGTDISAFINGMLGLVTMLITAVVLLVATVMFVARYIVLIFIMILSPLAFIGYIIPSMKGKFDDWLKQLLNQSFFAPYFMLITWVAIKIIVAIGPNIQQGVQFASVSTAVVSTIGLFLNFALVIGFLIAAIILSKKMATSTAGFATIAGGVINGAGIIGRNTVGRGSKAIMQSEALRNASKESGVKGRLARATLWTSKQGAAGSFDARGIADTKLGKSLGGKEIFDKLGKAGGAGGVLKAREDYLKDKGKAKTEYAKIVYSQTEGEKYKAKDLEEIYNTKNSKFENEKQKEEKKIKAEKESVAEKAKGEKDVAEKELNDIKSKAMYDGQANDIRTAEEKLKTKSRLHTVAVEKVKSNIEDSEFSAEVKTLKKEVEDRKKDWEKVKFAGKERQKSYAIRLEDTVFSGLRGNKEAAQKVRDAAEGKTGKSKKEVKKLLEEAGVLEEDKKDEGSEEKKPEGGDKKEEKKT